MLGAWMHLCAVADTSCEWQGNVIRKSNWHAHTQSNTNISPQYNLYVWGCAICLLCRLLIPNWLQSLQINFNVLTNIWSSHWRSKAIYSVFLHTVFSWIMEFLMKKYINDRMSACVNHNNTLRQQQKWWTTWICESSATNGFGYIGMFQKHRLLLLLCARLWRMCRGYH